MGKFNIGDIVKLNFSDNIYSDKEFKVVDYEDGFYMLESDGYSCYGVAEEYLEAVEDNKIDNRELTFREVIVQIKEGEVWEDVINKNITISKNGINLNGLDWTNSMLMSFDSKFKLQRKEYTFEEAFRSYEEGKEIESCVSGYKYKKGNLNATTLYGQDYLIQGYGIPISDISGNWYINE